MSSLSGSYGGGVGWGGPGSASVDEAVSVGVSSGMSVASCRHQRTRHHRSGGAGKADDRGLHSPSFSPHEIGGFADHLDLGIEQVQLRHLLGSGQVALTQQEDLD